jgi:hypothetical protein
MSTEDDIKWICEPCGDLHGMKPPGQAVAYTGMTCSWCRGEGLVVYRPDVFGIPVRNPETKQLELDV